VPPVNVRHLSFAVMLLASTGCVSAPPPVVSAPPPAPAPVVEVMPVQPGPECSPGAVWIPGRWVARPNGYARVEGHWRVR
jgi:hypothetical protein